MDPFTPSILESTAHILSTSSKEEIYTLNDVKNFNASGMPWCTLYRLISYQQASLFNWKLGYLGHQGTGTHQYIQQALAKINKIWGYWRCLNHKCNKFIPLHIQPRSLSGLAFYEDRRLWHGHNRKCKKCGTFAEYVETCFMLSGKRNFIDGIIGDGDTYVITDFKRNKTEDMRWGHKSYQIPQLSLYWDMVKNKKRLKDFPHTDKIEGAGLWYLPANFDKGMGDNPDSFPVFFFDNNRMSEFVKESVEPSIIQKKLFKRLLREKEEIKDQKQLMFCRSDTHRKNTATFCGCQKLCFGKKKKDLLKKVERNLKLMRKKNRQKKS